MAPPNTLISKLKVHLKLSISRLRIVQQKDTAIAKQQRRSMAQLLEQGKYESARIRVENIIRSDLITELHEILELYCELLLARAGLLEPKELDPGLAEAVVSIVYAAPRTDIKELQSARTYLVEKFGREWTMGIMELKGESGEKVPERVKRRLRAEPPSTELVESYLKAIAHAYDIPYGDDDDDDGVDGGTGEAEEIKESVETNETSKGDDEGGGGGGAKEPPQKALEPALTTNRLARDTPTPPRDLGPRSPVRVAPPSPSTDNANPQVKLPGPPDLRPGVKMKKQAAAAAVKKAKDDAPTNGDKALDNDSSKPAGNVPDVNDLEKRFALLKR
ncbi:MAG: hypothetical protein M1828_003072 [Chrysothrix sp. TS-e1954]|nr:MAG: hypothetical protein M1828_003072 [Chrysothrix sp. TS-e1954]